MRMLAFAGVPTQATSKAHPTDDRHIGMFLLALWSASMVLLTWDMTASASASCPADTTCLGSGFEGVHAAMQAILFLLALGTGGTGARLWLAVMPQRA